MTRKRSSRLCRRCKNELLEHPPGSAGRPRFYCEDCRTWKAQHDPRPVVPLLPEELPTEKRCNKCSTTKSLEEFNRDKSRKDGRFPWCKLCHRQHTKEYKESLSPDERRRRIHQHVVQREALRGAELRHYRRAYGLEKRYGITVTQYNEIWDSQNGRCRICNSPAGPDLKKQLGVDHDHTTGKVRGLLCGNCNSGLGMFKDDPQLLLSAITYLNIAGTLLAETCDV